MGPFFALGHALGLGPWLVQRLWLGLILALAAWGAVKLMDELAGRRGVAHAVTGLVVLLNPYVVVFTGRTTVTLLGYAALPWLLVCVKRGLGRGWMWPAAFALIVTASGGGRERGRDRLDARRPAAPGALRALDGAGELARAVGLRLADRPDHRPRQRVVGRAVARPVALRRRLPALHRAAGDDLEHHEPVRVAAPDGLLDLLSRRRLRGRAAPVLRRRRGAPVRAARGRGRAAGARAGADRVRLEPQGPLRAVRAAARARRPARDGRGLPGGHPAAAGVELHVQPLRPRPVPAHDLQGRPAGGDRARGAGGIGRRARAPAGVAGPAARVAAGRELAADPRAGARRPAPVGSDPGGLGRRGRARGRQGRPRGRPARSAVRLLRLGRDDRPDPAGPGRHARRHSQRRRLCRPARDRPAVDRRRARPAAAGGAGAARPAAGPAGRPDGGCRRRRRPHPQRRGARRRGRRRPRSAGAPFGGVGAGRAAGRGRRGRSGRRGRCRRCAPGTGRVRPGSCASSRSIRRSSSTAPAKGWPRSRRSVPSATWPTRAISRPHRSVAQARSSSPIPTGAGSSCRRGWPRTPGRCWRPASSRRWTPRC